MDAAPLGNPTQSKKVQNPLEIAGFLLTFVPYANPAAKNKAQMINAIRFILKSSFISFVYF
jgi:hypothetical protein